MGNIKPGLFISSLSISLISVMHATASLGGQCTFKAKSVSTNQSSKILNISLHDRNPSLNQMFAAIGSTPSGRRLLKQVLPRIESREISIQMAKQNTLGLETSGSYHFGSHILKLDPNEELGERTIALFHELIHSTDDIRGKKIIELNSSIKKLEQAAQKQRLSGIQQRELDDQISSKSIQLEREIFGSERRAFDAEHAFVLELIQAHPYTDRYLAAKKKHAKNYTATHRLTDEEIIRYYDLWEILPTSVGPISRLPTVAASGV